MRWADVIRPAAEEEIQKGWARQVQSTGASPAVPPGTRAPPAVARLAECSFRGTYPEIEPPTTYRDESIQNGFDGVESSFDHLEDLLRSLRELAHQPDREIKVGVAADQAPDGRRVSAKLLPPWPQGPISTC
jgi:hypothetical protein